MGLLRLGAFTLSSLALAFAFQDTSPLFLFSTSKELDGFETRVPQLTTESHVTAQVQNVLKGCTTKSYVVVSQPNVRTADYASAAAAPYLQRYVARDNKKIVSSTTIPEVVGGTDAEVMTTYLKKQCGASVTEVNAADGYISLADNYPRVIKVQFMNLAQYPEERMASLKQNDIFLDAVIQSLHDEANFTVIYTTTPPPRTDDPGLSQQEHVYGQYEMDDGMSALHVELKRDLGIRTSNDSLPLFEKYMFLSPGIFMGFIAILPLFLLAYVGVSAVAGLEVSYFAFSKEMGPAAQKKQQ
ncbi:BIG1-domain-containing protein [Pseudovirgaria hyperparasitica]|uniref:Protein BIG1 n=1 Tax=Pseudovirgaria hyperparasitica TaxID=470096 RepID=A0A6A6WC04_9PEZI|nr:BIG1-domain-containing protein [Pseudovirgaria hyperparasitica]KAF2759376.1 BIG1-domain-containing protein [Pseudovirgaria hyperparasitica]